MSKENLEQFIQQISDSEELQTRIGEEIDAEALIALGAECDCEFTAEELEETAELSDEELDAVAGGGWCFVKIPGGKRSTTYQYACRYCRIFGTGDHANRHRNDLKGGIDTVDRI